jgi:hypothetical protein
VKTHFKKQKQTKKKNKKINSVCEKQNYRTTYTEATFTFENTLELSGKTEIN